MDSKHVFTFTSLLVSRIAKSWAGAGNEATHPESVWTARHETTILQVERSYSGLMRSVSYFMRSVICFMRPVRSWSANSC